MSKFTLALLLVLIVAVVFLLVKPAGGPDPEYWVKRADYDAAVALGDKKLDAALAVIASKDAVIAGAKQEASAAKSEQARLETVLAKQRQEDGELKAENERLTTELEPLIAANPKLQELIRSFNLRLFNKDHQIDTITQERDQARVEARANFNAYTAAAAQAATWKGRFEDEHALRLDGDALRLGLEHDFKTSSFWAFLGKWGPPVAFGVGLILGK